MTTQASLVEMRDIRVSFGGVHAVDSVTVDLHAGEVIGLAGLAGHGQRELLLALFAARGRSTGPVRLAGPVAYVSGDRQVEGELSFIQRQGVVPL